MSIRRGRGIVWVAGMGVMGGWVWKVKVQRLAPRELGGKSCSLVASVAGS